MISKIENEKVNWKFKTMGGQIFMSSSYDINTVL